MNFNKKGLLMLPLAALLLASCNNPWKSISYEKAKEFINEHYPFDTTEVYPAKVHEKCNITVADNDSKMVVTGLVAFAFFYSSAIITELPWSDKAPYKCNYEDDYVPDSTQMMDPPIFPIVSERIPMFTTDYLEQSDKDSGLTVTYQVNGNKFKQNTVSKVQSLKSNISSTYNEKGYRLTRSGKCSANGEITNPSTGETMTVNFSFTYSGTYFYKE